MNPPEPTHWAPLLIPGLLSAIFGLIGVALGGWIAIHNQSKERRHRRYEEQLRFYAELFSIRRVIRAKSELRVKLHAMAHSGWRDQVSRAGGNKALLDQADPEYQKLFDYSDTQLREEIIPLYRKMLDYWTANKAQAEPSTQQHFATFVDYVEIWNRFLQKSLPASVIEQIGHEEKKLYPLYEDIEKNVERLRKQLLK
jgi:hypothetical protein